MLSGAIDLACVSVFSRDVRKWSVYTPFCFRVRSSASRALDSSSTYRNIERHLRWIDRRALGTIDLPLLVAAFWACGRHHRIKLRHLVQTFKQSCHLRPAQALPHCVINPSAGGLPQPHVQLIPHLNPVCPGPPRSPPFSERWQDTARIGLCAT